MHTYEQMGEEQIVVKYEYNRELPLTKYVDEIIAPFLIKSIFGYEYQPHHTDGLIDFIIPWDKNF